MAATTNTIELKPGAGWVLLAPAVTDFLRLNHTPMSTPFYITTAASLPTGQPQGGFQVLCASEHFDGANTLNVYGRVQDNANGSVRVFVWAN